MAKKENTANEADQVAPEKPAPKDGDWVTVTHSYGTNELFYRGTDKDGDHLFSKKNHAGLSMKATFVLPSVESIEVI